MVPAFHSLADGYFFSTKITLFDSGKSIELVIDRKAPGLLEMTRKPPNKGRFFRGIVAGNVCVKKGIGYTSGFL